MEKPEMVYIIITLFVERKYLTEFILASKYGNTKSLGMLNIVPATNYAFINKIFLAVKSKGDVTITSQGI